jgi:hypothetical protein
MGNFFIWLSGADRSILAKCTHLPKSERNRFAGLGALVLIPAILGLFSMMYAVSTIVRYPTVYVPAGIVWFFIVVAIDRYLVSTVYKSSYTKGYGRSLGISSRVVLAIFVGLAVSHPTVLLFFRDSIKQELVSEQQSTIQAINSASDAKRAAVLAEPHPPTTTEPSAAAIVAAGAASQELTAKIALSTCLGALQTAEQSGQQVQLPCGFSSPLVSCGPRCNAIGQQKMAVDSDIIALRAQVAKETADEQMRLDAAAKDQRDLVAADDTRRKTELAAIDQRTADDLKSVQTSFSDDYLARVKALSRIEAREPEVGVVQWFLILFFILIDLLPLTMKIATPPGEYEEQRDSALQASASQQGLRREVIKSTYGSPRMVQQQTTAALELAELKMFRATLEEDMEDITQATMSLTRRLADDTEAMDEVIGRVERRDGSTGKNGLVADELRNIQARRWKGAVDRLKGVFERKPGRE